jgi:hypothetical protein
MTWQRLESPLAAPWPSVLSTTQGTVVDKDYSRRVQRAPRK